ncbi:hypothetical protein CW304_07050 [Bacillus sp. UFRGS-B20]|nr:hypothetical protein CW304_07050 [Bacillus sp. UFRGS-B20]
MAFLVNAWINEQFSTDAKKQFISNVITRPFFGNTFLGIVLSLLIRSSFFQLYKFCNNSLIITLFFFIIA